MNGNVLFFILNYILLCTSAEAMYRELTIVEEVPSSISVARISRSGCPAINTSAFMGACVYNQSTSDMLCMTAAGSAGTQSKLPTQASAGVRALEDKQRGENKALRDVVAPLKQFPRELMALVTQYCGARGMFPRLWRASLQITHGLRHGRVARVAFSFDSRKIATTDLHGNAAIWNVEDGALLHTLRHQLRRGIYTCTFSPDDSKLISSEILGRDTCIWDVANGQLLHTFPLVGHADFNFDGTQVVTIKTSAADNVRHERIWDAQTGAELLKSQYKGPLALEPDDPHYSFDGNKTVQWVRNRDDDEIGIDMLEASCDMHAMKKMTKQQIGLLLLLEQQLEKQAIVAFKPILKGYNWFKYSFYQPVKLEDIARDEHLDMQELVKAFYSFDPKMQATIRNTYGLPDTTSFLPFVTASYSMWRYALGLLFKK